ncbi:MAG: 3-oxoacyl-[acyl-carrier-protein] reductase [Chloroflexi bacterium]|jgi:3-oxoacyl-[acyl-carrier protein] reductase|nr:3-oxoacyl-[acyl-carrier-protein] reductase [Chloroflexota bacterium]
MNSLNGRVAIVTGSSRGIGRAIALELALRGAGLVINYHSNAAAAQEVVREIESLGAQALAVQADVRTAEGAEALVRAALEAFGQIDILVSNAGIVRDTLLLRMSPDDWHAVIETNLTGAFHCAKAVQRTMLKQRSGRIIHISSVSGLVGNAGQANYSAAKAGLIGLTKALARELGSRNITVNAVAPGYIATDMTASLTAERVEAARKQTALGRLGEPEDVARAVAFLASDDAAYITGHVLVVDGGLAM